MFLIFRWNISFNTSLVNKVQIPCGLLKTLLKCSSLSVSTEGRVSPQIWCAMTDGDSTRVPVYSMYKTTTDSARGHPTNLCFPSSWSLSFLVDWKKLPDMYMHRPHQQQTGALKHLPSLRIQIMSVITFCSLDAVLHIVICSLQCSSFTWIHIRRTLL